MLLTLLRMRNIKEVIEYCLYLTRDIARMSQPLKS